MLQILSNSTGQKPEEMEVCVSLWMCPGMHLCVTMFNLAQLKQNCWLCERILFSLWQNISFFFFSTLRSTISCHVPNPFWLPGLYIKNKVMSLNWGTISNYAPGETVINDWYFVFGTKACALTYDFSLSHKNSLGVQDIFAWLRISRTVL